MLAETRSLRAHMRGHMRGLSLFTLLSALTLSVCAVSMSACTKEQKKALVAGPAIPGLNLSGGFDCAQFGFMKLRHTGKLVQGTYEGIRNNGDNGNLRAEVEGDLLWVDWVQPGDLESAILPKQGKGWLRVSPDGHTLTGRWGYGESREDGGAWVATRSEFVVD